MATYEYGYTLTWPGAGSPGRSTWHFREDSGGITSIQDIVDGIDVFWIAMVNSGALAPPYTVTGDSLAIDVATRLTETVSPLAAAVAGPAVEYNPTGQIVCTKRTASATRAGRGRVFIGPVKSSVTDVDGTPDSGVITLLQNACNDLVAFSAGLTQAAVGVYSREQSIFRDLTAMQARDYMAVLRSRRD